VPALKAKAEQATRLQRARAPKAELATRVHSARPPKAEPVTRPRADPAAKANRLQAVRAQALRVRLTGNLVDVPALVICGRLAAAAGRGVAGAVGVAAAVVAEDVGPTLRSSTILRCLASLTMALGSIGSATTAA